MPTPTRADILTIVPDTSIEDEIEAEARHIDAACDLARISRFTANPEPGWSVDDTDDSWFIIGHSA